MRAVTDPLWTNDLRKYGLPKRQSQSQELGVEKFECRSHVKYHRPHSDESVQEVQVRLVVESFKVF